MKYYSEGCDISPPPCCQVNCVYTCCSKNALNVRLGRVGTSWGKKYRSQIFFVSFWVSFVAWVLIALAVCSMSTTPAVVTALPFFQGTIALTNTSTNVVSELSFFAGLNIMVVEDCSRQTGTATCPAHAQAWSSVECEQYLDNCQQCRDSSTGSVTTVLIALVTQFLQIGADIQRSSVGGDFHFMKFIGIATGLIGLISTLAALNAFANACFRDLQPSVDNISIHRQFGAAFTCLVVATILKVVDIVAHVVVPVPEEGCWEPTGVDRRVYQLEEGDKCNVVEVREFNGSSPALPPVETSEA